MIDLALRDQREQPPTVVHGGQFWPWNHFVRLQQPFTAGLHLIAGSVGLHQPRHWLLGATVGDHAAAPSQWPELMRNRVSVSFPCS